MEKGKKIWMDGRLVPWDRANVHILTHTLHYGFGVFEGIRCYRCSGGRSAVFRLREHTERLFASAHIAMLKIPFSPEEINSAVVRTLKANNLKAVEEIAQISSRLVVNQASLKLKRAHIQPMLDAFAQAVNK